MHKGKREISHERLSWWMPDALSSAVRSAYFVSPGILRLFPEPLQGQQNQYLTVFCTGNCTQSRNYREVVGVDNILVFFVCLFSVVNNVRIVTEPNT